MTVDWGSLVLIGEQDASNSLFYQFRLFDPNKPPVLQCTGLTMESIKADADLRQLPKGVKHPDKFGLNGQQDEPEVELDDGHVSIEAARRIVEKYHIAAGGTKIIDGGVSSSYHAGGSARRRILSSASASALPPPPTSAAGALPDSRMSAAALTNLKTVIAAREDYASKGQQEEVARAGLSGAYGTSSNTDEGGGLPPESAEALEIMLSKSLNIAPEDRKVSRVRFGLHLYFLFDLDRLTAMRGKVVFISAPS